MPTPTITARIPNVLRHHTDGQRSVDVAGSTVAEALMDLFAKHPTLRGSLVPESGNVLDATNLFLNDEDISADRGLETPTKQGDTLTVLPAMAGGSWLVGRVTVGWP